MLDQNFCSFLEYQLTKAFKFSNNETTKQFWCDGVALPSNENDYSKKSINDNRKVGATAYMGRAGQEKYQLTIQFGEKALSRYSRNLDIRECVPNIEKDDWYTVDPVNKLIIIQLL